MLQPHRKPISSSSFGFNEYGVKVTQKVENGRPSREKSMKSAHRISDVGDFA